MMSKNTWEKRVSRVIRFCEDAARAVGIAALLLIMVIIACDVVLRYVANAPLAWAYDFIGLYLMPALFFLPLGYVQRCQGNIAVDLLVQLLPARGRRLLFRLGNLVATVLFAATWHLYVQKSSIAIETGEEIIGPRVWITWPIYAMVALGLTFFVLRLIYQLFQSPDDLDRDAAVGGHSQ